MDYPQDLRQDGSGINHRGRALTKSFYSKSALPFSRQRVFIFLLPIQLREILRQKDPIFPDQFPIKENLSPSVILPLNCHHVPMDG